MQDETLANIVIFVTIAICIKPLFAEFDAGRGIRFKTVAWILVCSSGLFLAMIIRGVEASRALLFAPIGPFGSLFLSVIFVYLKAYLKNRTSQQKGKK